LGQSLKTAFLNRWNLLALAGGTGFALLSGRPDVLLPIVLAIETAYVALLGTHPKFQKYVAAQAAKRGREASPAAEAAAQQLLGSLPRSAVERFERLRTRCLELRQICGDLKRSRGEPAQQSLDALQLQGLDKLLWMFIRLLFTQYSLWKFLQRTSDEQIQEDIKQLELRLSETPAANDLYAQKMRRTLEDHLQTCRDRLANYDKAKANSELVALEIDRLENKISTLAELAINRQEPDFIADQVDAVAGSMLEMERTMNDLQFATGLAPLDEQVPELMEAAAPRTKAVERQ
jgi:hypothetical protein